jgi:Na+-transporting methylmalonyl-CoA/oxaloacetate decarboxylase gamma subunit
LDHDDIRIAPLSDDQLQVLQDVRLFLSYFHTVQEVVSAEQTPTLSLVLPLYEQLIVLLQDLKLELPKLEHAISAAIMKLEEYLVKSRKAKIYVLAMGMFLFLLFLNYLYSVMSVVLNPTTKFEWIKEHWPEEEYQNARETVVKAVSYISIFFWIFSQVEVS